MLADVTVDVALDPNAEEEEQDTYYYGTLRKYVWGVNDGNGALTCLVFAFFFLS